MKSSLYPLILLCGVALTGTGCVSLEETTFARADAPPIRFSTKAAAVTFYNAVLQDMHPDPGSDGSIYTGSLMFSPVKEDSRYTSGYILRDAMQKIDTNHDGLITEKEANVYAAAIDAKEKKGR